MTSPVDVLLTDINNNMHPQIDLHCHSTASDGTLSPAQLVELAKETGLKALALTDHDTTLGLEEAVKTGQRLGVEIIPGCELSVDFKPGTMHIIGLWLPMQAPNLNKTLEDLRQARHNRNHLIIAKLNELGINISYEQVRVIAGQGSVGRPHLAQALVQARVVPNVQTAFDEYLGNGKKAHVPKAKLSPEAAIQALKQDGGTVILAHPYSLNLNLEETEQELLHLQALGLDGIEVYYSLHDKELTANYLQMANRLGLLVSAGSDFHGSVKPDIELGRGRQNNLCAGYELLATMKTHRQNHGLAC